MESVEIAAGPNAMDNHTSLVAAKVQIALSVGIYAQALAICEKRNCNLETIVEDLLSRFLPTMKDEPGETRSASLSAPLPQRESEQASFSRWARKPHLKKRKKW